MDFTKDMQTGEVSQYESLLPMNPNKDRKGSTLLIYSPEVFRKWLGDEPAATSIQTADDAELRDLGLLQRLRLRLRKRP